MNREQRRTLERRLKKIGDQTLPSGRLITAKELYAAMRALWITHGEEAYDKVLAAVEHGNRDVLASVEVVIDRALLAAEKLGLIAPPPLGESG